MDMGPGRPTRCTHFTDELTTSQFVTYLDQTFAHVPIPGLQSVAMFYFDYVAQELVIARENYDAVRRDLDRRSVIGRNVHAVMLAQTMRKRIAARTESGIDSTARIGGRLDGRSVCNTGSLHLHGVKYVAQAGKSKFDLLRHKIR